MVVGGGGGGGFLFVGRVWQVDVDGVDVDGVEGSSGCHFFWM